MHAQINRAASESIFVVPYLVAKVMATIEGRANGVNRDASQGGHGRRVSGLANTIGLQEELFHCKNKVGHPED